MRPMSCLGLEARPGCSSYRACSLPPPTPGTSSLRASSGLPIRGNCSLHRCDLSARPPVCSHGEESPPPRSEVRAIPNHLGVPVGDQASKTVRCLPSWRVGVSGSTPRPFGPRKGARGRYRPYGRRPLPRPRLAPHRSFLEPSRPLLAVVREGSHPLRVASRWVKIDLAETAFPCQLRLLRS